MARKWFLGLALLGAAAIIVACSSPTPTPAAPTPVPPTTVPPTQPPPPTAIPEPTAIPLAVPFVEQWKGSGHADSSAVAFTNWDKADPKEVPVQCAKCHSSAGYQDFIGADGSPAGAVDKAAPTGSTVECVTCHNDVTRSMTSVTFPSGAEVKGLGDESRCMQCHQGRASGQTVLDNIAKAGLTDDDTPSEDLGFTNIHYFAAGATVYGHIAKGGFEYPDKAYDVRLAHVDEYDTCIECHDVHTLEVKVAECQTCHTEVETKEDFAKVRMAGSMVDYDGDGNIEEGVGEEMDGAREKLYAAIQAYAKDNLNNPIVYSPDAYPYFFKDTNANGTVDEGEAVRENGYKPWTGRLAKAAYNYQVSKKDPGAFAHGGKYIIQLMYDSTEDLNTVLATPIDMAGMHRIDSGHFAGSDEPFRDWDEAGEVPAGCSKCHAPGGLPQFLKYGANVGNPVGNGMKCTTCHDKLPEFTRYEVTTVRFPSGKVIDNADGALNAGTMICISCHQGRESTVSVNTAIRGMEPDVVNEKLNFRNIHYFAAGATLFGNEVQGAYQFTDKAYNNRLEHKDKFNECVECHDVHTQEVKVAECADCHDNVASIEDLQTIRMTEIDFDGNGDVTEGINSEITVYKDKLYAAIQAYGTANGAPIAYSSAAYPYFFNDLNANGVADPEEANRDNRFNKWTPRLLQSAYNYQYAAKDPGKFAHNPMYILQVLYDSLENIGGDMTGLTRPEAPAAP